MFTGFREIALKFREIVAKFHSAKFNISKFHIAKFRIAKFRIAKFRIAKFRIDPSGGEEVSFHGTCCTMFPAERGVHSACRVFFSQIFRAVEEKNPKEQLFEEIMQVNWTNQIVQCTPHLKKTTYSKVFKFGEIMH
jgi:hypothetical protein